jgi:hypothetical protein
MQESEHSLPQLKAEQPIESPSGSDPVARLMKRLLDEGFTTDQSEEEWAEFGEIFIFTRVPEINERILRQTSQSVVHSYSARGISQKALSVLQSTTVYHCLVSQSEQPHNETLNPFITRTGGATFIPVVIVPDINEVLYPVLEEKVGSIRPRVEYLQYLLGERRETVNMHRMTVQAFYVSVAVVVLLLIAIGLSFVY